MTDIQDLMARMLTCAARITEIETVATSDSEVRSMLPVAVTRDAGSLLIEAARELEILRPAEPLGEPMEILPQPQVSNPGPPPGAADLVLPHHDGTGCPQCKSVTAKKVQRFGRKLVLTCPICTS